MPQRKDNRSGFVLLVTLVLLSLAGVVACAVARQSGALALRANGEQHRLRRRWAMTSIQHTLGRRAPDVILDAEAALKRPVHWVRRRITLDGMEVELLYGDEQARANANVIYLRDGQIGLVQSLGRLAAGLRQRDRIPRPAAVRQGTEGPSQPFESFEQLLGGCTPEDLVAPFTDEAPAIEAVTCFGDGKINFRRSPRAALAEIARGGLDPYQQEQLLSLRTEVPGISLAEALKRLELSDKQLAQAATILTDRSGCFSLWMTVRTPDRCWHRLGVYRLAPGWAQARLVGTFTW